MDDYRPAGRYWFWATRGPSRNRRGGYGLYLTKSMGPDSNEPEPMTANAPEQSARTAYAIAIIGGALLWLAATLISGKREAWDSSLYWTVAYPLSIVLAG